MKKRQSEPEYRFIRFPKPYRLKKGADFLIAGHIFQTDCKKDLAPRGVKFLTEIVSNVEIPVYAIGGINPQNEHLIYECGANGICIMSGYMK